MLHNVPRNLPLQKKAKTACAIRYFSTNPVKGNASWDSLETIK